MKKTTFILSLILVFALFFRCSTSNDSNGNSTTIVVPVTPTNLAGTVISTTQINLSWTDNSTNETGFKIERKTGTGTYAVIGSVNADVLTYNDLGLTPNTTYTYRIYSFNAAGNSPTYSNEVTLTTNSQQTLPILATTTPATITTTTASSGGNITSDGGSTITARGVVWSPNPNPTIALATKTTDGTGIGSFTSSIEGLNANTTYYVKSYATNSVGTAYGNELSFTTNNTSTTSVTDIDENTYQLVTICNQTWTKSNLNVSHYRNGDIIPQVTDPTQWQNLTTGAWCYYNNDPSNGGVYGKLYNWYAVHDSRGLAPQGYHIPTDSEWNSLVTCLDPSYIPMSSVTNDFSLVAGGKMKETGTTHWASPNAGANNNSGFTALPAGWRLDSMNNDFNQSLGYMGCWWSSSEYNSTNALNRYVDYYDSNAYRGYGFKYYGYTVRCLKD